MLNTKDVGSFIGCFAGVASRVVTITIPDEENAVPAETLAEAARAHGLAAETAAGLEAALRQASLNGSRPAHPDLRFALSRRPRAGRAWQ